MSPNLWHGRRARGFFHSIPAWARRPCHACVLFLLLGTARAASAASETSALPTAQPAILQNVGIDQRIGAPVPQELIFRDDAGTPVRLGNYFGRKPLVLALVYYKCPMLCTMVLNDLTKSLNGMSLTAGRDFDVLTISFDPKETPVLAAEKKLQYLRAYRRPGAEAGWHFLTGSRDSIDAVTRAVGFRYAWDAEHQLYAHASGIMILTPDGTVSRYFFGVDYVPADLRIALDQAALGTLAPAPTPDPVLLYCFRYDPRTGRYGLIVSRALQVGGVVTLAILSGGILLMLRSERKRATATIETEPARDRDEI